MVSRLDKGRNGRAAFGPLRGVPVDESPKRGYCNAGRPSSGASRVSPPGNSFGVETRRRIQPGVARASQPRAGGLNPFGIGAWGQ